MADGPGPGGVAVQLQIELQPGGVGFLKGFALQGIYIYIV